MTNDVSICVFISVSVSTSIFAGILPIAVIIPSGAVKSVFVFPIRLSVHVRFGADNYQYGVITISSTGSGPMRSISVSVAISITVAV